MKGTPEEPRCGFSFQVVRVLHAEGVDFDAVDVLADAEIREGVKSFSDWPTIPQLYVEKEFVGGCDIVTSMHQDGELATLFKEANVSVGSSE
jgi:monothiol glutaredoxin